MRNISYGEALFNVLLADGESGYKAAVSPSVSVEVTQEDINRGVPSDADRCPVALALKRRFPKSAPDLHVENNLVIYAPEGDTKRFQVPPEEVQRFTMKFDEGKPVEPLTFAFPPPPADFLTAKGN